jgi:hypothetical protein
MFSRILTRSIVRSSIVEHGIGVTRALSNMGGHMITKTDKERKKTQRVRMTEKRDLRYKMQVDADIVAAAHRGLSQISAGRRDARVSTER